MKRITVRLDEDTIERYKNACYHLRISITEFINEAVGSHVGQYEREHGGKFPERKKRK